MDHIIEIAASAAILAPSGGENAHDAARRYPGRSYLMETHFVPSGDGVGNAAVVALLDPEQQPLAAAMARQDCAAELRVARLRVADLERELAGPLCGAARSYVLSELRRRCDRCARLAQVVEA